MKKYGKKILLGLFAVLALLQFYHPEKNVSGESSHDITTKYNVPDDVKALLKPACFDCHSNYTNYPWYAAIQPVGMWLTQHVNEGKRELNFSAFTSRKIAIQNHKFDEIIEVVKKKEMPLASYTWMHKDAVLSDEQRLKITNWAQSMMDSLSRQYPADSLVLRRK